ncbi:hypothetical protein QS460_04365 [Liquorilactobacillus mali]|uniref:hypothetical protein n=1 Tax=Liquorilactobacillus mali TaxID=1618 RepID=UPI0026559596|nr:hypothetical protein [Liquorilactobacillus mali]MDN7145159.1 hypothetical protein [Liquorilactobacillus mali]
MKVKIERIVHMRLNEISTVLKQAITDMTGVEGTGASANNMRAVANYSTAIKALQRIEPLGIVNTNIDKLKQRKLIYLGIDSPKMIIADINFLVQQINLAIAKCQGAVGIIEKQIPAEKKETLAMKLPSSNSYEMFIYTNKQFDKALTLLNCLPEFNKKPQISNLDVGSGWIIFCFSTYTGLALFEKMLSVINTYRQTRIAKKLGEVRIEELNLELTTRQELQRALDEEVLADFTQLSKELMKSIQGGDSPEKIASISKAMKILADLMDSGTSFHQSVLTDKETEKILPTEKEQTLFSKEYQKLIQQNLLENKPNDK